MSLVALIDIGSTSVGGALVAEPKNHKDKVCSRIVFSTRNETSFQEEINLPQFLSGIEAVLKKTLSDLQLFKTGTPRRIICFLSGPFYAAQTRVIKYKTAAPFVVTPKLVRDLVGGDMKELKERGVAGASLANHELIEDKVMRLKLNGYVPEVFYGQKASTLEIFHFVSVASVGVLKRFRKLISAAFQRDDTEFHSFVFPLFRVLGDLLPVSHNVLFLDIGGEITEVSVVWQGILWENASFPLGRNFVVRKLARTLKTSPPEAYSALRLHLNSQQHDATSKRVADVLLEAKSEWFNFLLKTLDIVINNCLLPANMYLVGDHHTLPLFRNWLADSQIDSNLGLGQSKSGVVPLRPDLLSSFCDHVNTVSQDLSLMIEAIFYDKMRFV